MLPASFILQGTLLPLDPGGLPTKGSLPGARSKERSELPARFCVSEELHQASWMEVPLPCPLAVVKAEIIGLIHVMDRKLFGTVELILGVQSGSC